MESLNSYQFTSLIWKVIDDFKTQYYQIVVALGSVIVYF